MMKVCLSTVPILGPRICEAETELLSIVSHPNLSVEVAAKSLSSTLAMPEAVASVKPALGIALQRFPPGAEIVLRVVGQTLHAGGVNDAAEGVILELARDEGLFEAMAKVHA
jgi:hypothetical protein